MLAALLLTALATAQVQVEEYTLDNGMSFLLVPRTEQPNNIAAGWVAHVGSVNERPGITGDWAPVAKGDLGGKATMAPYGEPTHLPLRDPLTQEAP